MKRITVLSLLFAGIVLGTACQSITQEEFQEVQNENRQLEQENAELNEQVFSLRSENEDLQQRNEELNQTVSDLRETLTNLRERVNQLQQNRQQEQTTEADESPGGDIQIPDDLSDQVNRIEVNGRVGLRPEESILFLPGSANLTEEGQQAVQSLVDVLQQLDSDVRFRVAGHTDNQPIQQAADQFPTNWHLSVSRATTVAMNLIDEGIEEDRIEIAGYADTRPIASNDSEEGRRQNRRVEVIILPSN